MSTTTRLVKLRRLVSTGEARAIRLDARLSLRELAREANVTAATVHRWENAQCVPRGERAERYLAALERIRKAIRA